MLERAGISRRRPRPTWHRMPPFPLTGTPLADTALAESWEQWGPGNLPALFPSPPVHKLPVPKLKSGWDVCKNYSCIFLYLLTLSGPPLIPSSLCIVSRSHFIALSLSFFLFIYFFLTLTHSFILVCRSSHTQEFTLLTCLPLPSLILSLFTFQNNTDMARNGGQYMLCKKWMS